ncbi:hypothetical protein Godav_023502 [Gossypium davidsonii]|uniref:Uncharacterized protein n=1 Tax=Gossypium davidsonii TaxID=34287 RepID=A0A7J8SSG2_GOSDV|nr:hypothetical protein [Gossypium davidsonii]
MKFCKKYQEYMQGQQKKLPGVGFKKILKNCRREFQSMNDVHGVLHNQTCPQHCPERVFMPEERLQVLGISDVFII